MTKKTVDDDFTENIIDVDVSREMENSFLELQAARLGADFHHGSSP